MLKAPKRTLIFTKCSCLLITKPTWNSSLFSRMFWLSIEKTCWFLRCNSHTNFSVAQILDMRWHKNISPTVCSVEDESSEMFALCRIWRVLWSCPSLFTVILRFSEDASVVSVKHPGGWFWHHFSLKYFEEKVFWFFFFSSLNKRNISNSALPLLKKRLTFTDFLCSILASLEIQIAKSIS